MFDFSFLDSIERYLGLPRNGVRKSRVMIFVTAIVGVMLVSAIIAGLIILFLSRYSEMQRVTGALLVCGGCFAIALYVNKSRTKSEAQSMEKWWRGEVPWFYLFSFSKREAADDKKGESA